MSGRQLNATELAAAPKVVLHDHLDGGLRSATLIELAESCGYDALPSTDPEQLGAQIAARADAGDLAGYLATFAHTAAVLQSPDALARVAAEAVVDLAADGVVYAELRFAPELHTRAGLDMDGAVEAVLDGIADGTAQVAARGRRIHANVIVCAIRTGRSSLDAARCALRWRDQGVVGFDLAGNEAGSPASLHADACALLRDEKFNVTVHAGEAWGPASISDALARCGAQRLGHGIRIIDDMAFDPAADAWTLGRLATWVRDRRIPLEVCPSSNVHTGTVASISEHPVAALAELGFRVTISCDNRLMSATSTSQELALLTNEFGWGLDNIERVNVAAMKSAFCGYDLRAEIIDDVLRPSYRAMCSPPTAPETRAQ